MADDYRFPDHWLLSKEGLFPIRHAAYVRRAVEMVRESGAESVLEVGCGDGWNCGQLVESGLRVAGIDRSENGIAHARRLVPAADFEVCDCRDSTYRARFPEPFDAVILVEVIEHIPPEDCPAVLENIAACLRSGGILVLTTPSTNVANSNPQHYRHFDAQALRDLVAPVEGLSLERVEGYGDARFERRHYRRARWVDNRLFRVKPVLRWLEQRYHRHVTQTPLARCSGLIALIRKP